MVAGKFPEGLEAALNIQRLPQPASVKLKRGPLQADHTTPE
jgi:hypothetical protein